MKKKSFTLVELLLVLIIVGVILGISSNLFSPSGKNKYYAQACLNKVFGEVRSFSNNAIFGKGVPYKGVFYFPQTYNIIFDEENNKIDLTIKTKNNGIINANTIYLSGDEKIKECGSNKYQIYFSGNVDKISIQKNLEEKGNIKGFTIIPNKFTGNIDFFMKEDGISRKISIFTVDQRIQNINHNRCFSLPKDIHKKCTQRSQ